MPAHKEASNDLAKQLHADAKEFVPSSVRDLCVHSSLDLSFLLMLGVMVEIPEAQQFQQQVVLYRLSIYGVMVKQLQLQLI